MAERRRFQTTTVEVEGREETKVVELPDRELEPWGDDADLHVVGQPVERVDAAQKVTGSATYTTDIALPGMLHAVLVRSTIARGRVIVDLDPVRRLPGVVDAVSFDDLPPVAKPIRTGGVRFLDPDVSYVGQPVAVICATSLVLAEAAAQALIVRNEPVAAAVTAAQATANGAPPVRPHGNVSPSSPVREARGDADRALAAASVVVRGRYTTSAAIHSALEPHGAVAAWSGDQLTVHEGTQGVFKVRNDVAAALELPRGSVRVVMEHMGGGFGAKNYAGAHTLAAALLSRRTGRPVRCVLDRRGEQSDTGHRPPAVIEVALGADRDGTLLAIIAEAVVDQGVSGWESSTTKVFHELYACANVRTAETFVYTNTHAMAAFRGPGHTEGTFALERAMDELARALGMDPLALRLHNVPAHDQEKSRPYSAGTGALKRCLEEAARRFGWVSRGPALASSNELQQPATSSSTPQPAPSVTPAAATNSSDQLQHPATSTEPDHRYRRGRGIAAQVWAAGGGPPAYATVRIHPDASIDVLTGTQDLGTGARTIFAQVAAEALGARLQDVRVILGDTERTPYTGNSWGSMTTPSVAPAVRMAAEDARDSLIQAAAEILGAEPAAIRIVDGFICRPGEDPVPIAHVTRKLGQVTITGHGSRGPNPQRVALMTFGAQCAEVVVDTWTGRVRVERIIAVHDVGRVLNPRLARSQLEGGILQGLGFALFEERVLDERSGAPLNAGLHDYKIPTMADVPLIDASCLQTVDVTANAVGARGLAEPPIIPTAAAVGNAVADALGVPVDDLPLAPWRILAAVERGATQS